MVLTRPINATTFGCKLCWEISFKLLLDWKQIAVLAVDTFCCCISGGYGFNLYFFFFSFIALERFNVTFQSTVICTLQRIQFTGQMKYSEPERRPISTQMLQ